MLRDLSSTGFWILSTWQAMSDITNCGITLSVDYFHTDIFKVKNGLLGTFQDEIQKIITRIPPIPGYSLNHNACLIETFNRSDTRPSHYICLLIFWFPKRKSVLSSPTQIYNLYNFKITSECYCKQNFCEFVMQWCNIHISWNFNGKTCEIKCFIGVGQLKHLLGGK